MCVCVRSFDLSMLKSLTTPVYNKNSAGNTPAVSNSRMKAHQQHESCVEASRLGYLLWSFFPTKLFTDGRCVREQARVRLQYLHVHKHHLVIVFLTSYLHL